MAADLPAHLDPAAWQGLRSLGIEEWEDGRALQPLLELWRRHHAAAGAALYDRTAGEGFKCRLSVGSGSFPAELEAAEDAAGILELPGGLLVMASPAAGRKGAIELGPADYLLTAGARLSRLSGQLKAQSFQENYKVVKLEALYDVGLAITSTLNLEELYEEMLLRAVSLLDGRRGALYLLDDAGSYQLNRTIGGDAVESLAQEDPLVAQLLAGAGGEEQNVLPGASYPLAVPITIDGAARGLLVIADKESRRGVGPFLEADRRTLQMFGSQAAIALENASLHLQALEKERLERELELAAEIQRSILPARVPQLEGLEIVGWNRPTQQVGGDYYGFFRFGEGRLGVVVADVSGKGMPAALLVSTLHSALHLLLDHVQLGGELLSRLNEHIVDSSSPNRFITMIVVEVNAPAGRVGYLNAGHNPGLLVGPDGSATRLQPSGLPLGLMQDSRYRYEELEMGAGDLLCLYSDGITECASVQDEEFGLERLVDFLKEHRDLPLERVLAELDRRIAAFAAGTAQGDDQTVVLLRRSDD